MDRTDLTAFDADGALQQAAADADADLGQTRLGFLRHAGAAGGALAVTAGVSSVLAPTALANTGGMGRRYERGRPPVAYGRGDAGVLNFALLLEYLESAFYNEAKQSGAITDPATHAFLHLVVRDENAHVEILQSVLGSSAIKMPSFDFKGATSDLAMFQQTAYTLENTGVHAYLGQARNLYSPEYLTVAAGIATTEGRHAAIIGSILGDRAKVIAPSGPVDTPLSANSILTAVDQTGFITGGAPSGAAGPYTPPPTPEG